MWNVAWEIPLASLKTSSLGNTYKRKCKWKFDVPKLLIALNTQTFCFQGLLLTESYSFLLWFLKSQNISHLSFSIYKELEFRDTVGRYSALLWCHWSHMLSSISLNLHQRFQTTGYAFKFWNTKKFPCKLKTSKLWNSQVSGALI